MSALDKWRGQFWPYQYNVTLRVAELHGGHPQDPRVVEGWIRRVVQSPEQRIMMLLREATEKLGYTQEDLKDEDRMEQAITEASKMKLTGFLRDLETDELYIEGRAVKAMLKESANIAYPWENGKGVKLAAGKGVKNAFKEHIFVNEVTIPLGVKEPDDIETRFVTGARGKRTIVREEFVRDIAVNFSIVTDLVIKDEMWAKILFTAEKQGLGASRSQGYGTFVLETFEQTA